MNSKTLVLITALVGVMAWSFLMPSGIVSADGLNAPDQNIQGVYDGPLDNNPIYEWIQFGINTLTVVIIAGSAVMIAVAGIQYTSARDNSQAVQAAKDKLWNITIGLLFYMFLYAFAQWLIPGGVF